MEDCSRLRKIVRPLAPALLESKGLTNATLHHYPGKLGQSFLEHDYLTRDYLLSVPSIDVAIFPGGMIAESRGLQLEML
jgi:hypothetical protein